MNTKIKMKDYDNTEYICALYENIGSVVKDLEKDVHIQAMYGRVAGSVTQGLNSKASDNDFLVFCKKTEGYEGLSYEDSMDQKEGRKEVRNNPYEGHLYYTKAINGESKEIEMGYILYDAAMSRIKKQLGERVENFPSVDYRTQEESEKYANLHPLLRKREEYSYMMTLLLAMDDYLWVAADEWEHFFRDIYKMERVIDVLDTYYTRAVGNYNHFIKGKEKVAVRKYLYTLSHIFVMNWICQNQTKPPVNFMQQLNGIRIPEEVYASIERLLKRNKNTNVYKTKYMGEQDDLLTDYIAEMLDGMKSIISNYDRSSTLYDLIKGTETERRPKVYHEQSGLWKAVEL